MAQNVTIAGASYTDVPAVELAKTGGGTAKFVDPTELQTKSVTIVANGTTTVVADAGKDGLSAVNVTVALPVYDGSVT